MHEILVMNRKNAYIYLLQAVVFQAIVFKGITIKMGWVNYSILMDLWKLPHMYNFLLIEI